MSKYKYDILLGLPQVITLILIILKLTGVINWQWLLILSPVILEVGVAILLLIVLLILMIKK